MSSSLELSSKIYDYAREGYPITSLSSCKYLQTEGQKWEIEPKTGLDYDYLAKLNKTWVITQ